MHNLKPTLFSRTMWINETCVVFTNDKWTKRTTVSTQKTTIKKNAPYSLINSTITNNKRYCHVVQVATQCLFHDQLSNCWPFLFWCHLYFETYKSLLRGSLCKYRKSRDSFKILNYFAFCPNKPGSELFSKT